MSLDVEQIERIITRIQQTNPNINPAIAEAMSSLISARIDDFSNLLQDDTDRAILQLVGMRTDHEGTLTVSSFAKDSLFKETIQHALKDEITKLFTDLYSGANLSDLVTEKEKKSMILDYQKEYESSFQLAFRKEIEKVRDQAAQDAKDLAPYMVERYLGKSFDDIRADMITNILCSDEEVQSAEPDEDLISKKEAVKIMTTLYNKMIENSKRG